MRGHVRDLNAEVGLDTVTNNADGVRFSISVGNCVPATALVSFDRVRYEGSAAEASLEGNRLWLKAGEKMDAVVDPVANYQNDGTGLSVCYVKEGDVAATKRVVNVHFTERGTGKFSTTRQRPREGWADWNMWNALRAGDAASAHVRNCREGDGETRRNVTVALTRDSGTAIAKGASAEAGFFSYVSSSGATDTYTFTISNLKKNEPYTLYLYSVQSVSVFGNATFTIGGETKGLEEPWILGDGRKVLTRFEVTSDANGEITGTFAAADANGGAFNGLTIVGEFPDYKARGTSLVIR